MIMSQCETKEKQNFEETIKLSHKTASYQQNHLLDFYNCKAFKLNLGNKNLYVHNVRFSKNILFTRLKVKKLTIKMFRPNVFGCLPSSGLRKNKTKCKLTFKKSQYSDYIVIF